MAETSQHEPIFQSWKNCLLTLTTLHNYHVTAANVRAGLDPNHGVNDEPEYVEVYYQGDPAKSLHDRPCAPKEGEILVQRSYLTGARTAVVQRDDDTTYP